MTERIRHALSIPNSTAHLAAVRDIVHELVHRSAYPVKKDASVIVLAVDEAVANIMEHAYSGSPEGARPIDIELEVDDRHFGVTLRDRGHAFDPSGVQVPDLKAHVAQGRKSGLGLFLMRSIMDEISYTTKGDGANELHMTRLVKGGAARGAPEVNARNP